MGTSFDALLRNQSTPAAAPSPVVPKPTQTGTSFDAVLSEPAAPTQKATPEIPAPTGPTSFDTLLKRQEINPLTSLSDEERKQSSRPDPENNEDEPWYSKTWDWINKPLWDLHQYGTRTGAGSFERGVESGAEDLISGLTSPLSVALTIGTFGGDTALNLGVAGLKAVGVSAEAAPFVAHGVKALADLGFTTQALSGLVTQSPQFLDALKDGDIERAAHIGTNILAVGGLTALGATKTFEDADVVKDAINGKTASQIETLKTAKKIAGNLDLGNQTAGEKALDLETEIRKEMETAGIKNTTLMGGVRRYIEAQGDTNLLQAQHDATAGSLPVRPTGELATPQFNPSIKDFGQKKNFDEYVAKQHNGDVDAAKTELGRIVDAIQYTDENGSKIRTLVKPVDEIPKNHVWSNDYVYHASDVSRADAIRNSGIGKRGSKGSWYANSPEEALRSGVTPVSGNREDLRVFAVPRAEAEAAKIEPDKADIGHGIAAEGKSLFVGGKPIMPSHEIVIDDEGKPTGQSVPLRPDSPFNLTLDRERFENTHTEAEQNQILAEYKAAMNLTPEQKIFAERMRNFYSDQFDKASKEGIIRQAVEGYHPRAWVKDRPSFFQNLFGAGINASDNSALHQLRHQTDNGAFDTSVDAAKHRAYETSFQAEMAGEKNLTNDIAYHAANYQHHLDRAIAARNFLEEMRASGAKASDGRPLVALTPSSKVLGANSDNPALLVSPNSVRGIQISPKIVDSMIGAGQLEDLVNSGKVERLPFTRDYKNPATGEKEAVPAYAWSTEGYQSIDHPAMRDWAYAGKDTAGNNAIVKTDMRVHPEAADYIRQVVEADPSVFRTNPYLRTLMAAQREVKGSLLAFSPFHAVQEGLRGLMLGINPLKDASGNWLKWSPVHVSNDPLLSRGVRNGLTFPDHRAQDMFTDGVATHSKIIGKIPVANKIQNYIQDFTFNQLIPNLKARAFKSVYGRFLDRMPGESADSVARAASSYVNDTFGGQNWRELGITTSGQDAMRSIMLAPDWLTSEARSLYRVAGGMGKPAAAIARQDMARIAAGVYMTARVINMLSSGHPHLEAPFGLVVPGQNGQDDKVYSLRTLPTDLIHAMTDPRGFIEGRVNPLTVRTAIEGVTGRNELGQKVTPGQEVADTLRNFIPIGGQALLQGSTPGGLTNVDQLIKAGGASVYRYRTEAENLAQKKASDHMPSGPVDDKELAHHQRNLKIEDQVRNGQISKGDVRRLLPQREANQILQNSAMTPLQARFNRLPLNDALDVWNLATPSEKDSLHKLLWNKRLSYIQSHSSTQRSEDPVWRKMQTVYGDLQTAKPISTASLDTMSSFDQLLKEK
jgi:hypothetical protein